MTGDVDISHAGRSLRLLADEISVNMEEGTFTAAGNVSFEQGDLLLNGSSMRGDIDDSTLEMEDAIGVAPGPFYIRAEILRQLEPGLFEAERGVVTPCNQTTAIWEFRSGKMTFRPSSYVKMSWPHIRVKGVPVFGLPWIYWPLQDSQRQTGLLMPSIGSSNRKGFMLSQSFFWAMGRAADLTMTYEHFAQAGSGFGAQFRHTLSESAGGSIRGYYFPGRERTPEEEAAGKQSFEGGYSISGEHIQALPGQFTLRVGADFISSTQYARDFQDDINRFLQRTSYLNAEVTKNWGGSTLSLVANSNERFDSDTTSTVGRKLPMARYSLRSTQAFGSPVYVSLEASAARLQKLAKRDIDTDDPTEQGGAYSRLDAFPEVSVPITQIPWLTFNPFFRWRSTWWSHRAERKNEELDPDPVLRHFYETGLEIVGPSIFKIFENPGSDYSPRFKHLIQPRITYRRVRQLDTDGVARILRFDEIDSSAGSVQAVTTEITTRFFGKRYPNRDAEERMVSQLAEVTVGRNFALDSQNPELEELGAPRIRVPWFLSTRVTPTDRFQVDGSVGFTPGFAPASYRIGVNARSNSSGFGLTWFRGVRDFLDPDDFSNVLLETTSNTLSANGNTVLLGGSLSVGAGAGMDLFQNKLRSVTGSLQWNLQCCSIGFDVRRLNFTDRAETQFSLLLNLAQVGQLGFDNARR